jgi:acylphosphatase
VKAGFKAHGRVQGVGFRYFVLEAARALGLAGWVRNESDGTVSGEAGGDFSRLEAFRERLQQGSARARITRLDWWTADGGESLPAPFAVHY